MLVCYCVSVFMWGNTKNQELRATFRLTSYLTSYDDSVSCRIDSHLGVLSSQCSPIMICLLCLRAPFARALRATSQYNRSDIRSFFDRILGDRRGTSGPLYPQKLPVKNPLGLGRPSQPHILQGLPHEGVVMTSSNDVIWGHLDISYVPAKKKK